MPRFPSPLCRSARSVARPTGRLPVGARLAVLLTLTLMLVAAAPVGPARGLRAAQPAWPGGVLLDVRRTEPSLAINPRAPLDVVVAANSNYLPNKARHYPA